jgi:hypothetical protein
MPDARELMALGQYAGGPQPGRAQQLIDILKQTWPARAAQEAYTFATAPKRAYTGELQMWDPVTGHVSDEAVEAGTGMAGLAMTGGVPFPRAAGELRMGLSPGTRLFHGSPATDITDFKTTSYHGPLGKGVYTTPSDVLAGHYAKGGRVYELETEGLDVFNGAMLQSDAERAAFAADKQRIIDAAAPGPEREAVARAVEGIGEGQGEALLQQLRGAYGDRVPPAPSRPDRAAELLRRAGFHGLFGRVGGEGGLPELAIFDPAHARIKAMQ